MTRNPIFLITARGGSKGIPGKNIAPLCGKPLIAYTIEAALEVAPADRVMLSTDSQDIADVARSHGLTVDYMRPAELATDTCGSREVILDAMDWLDRHGISYDSVVLLQPTSPLRCAADIEAALNRFTSDIDMVVSVTEASANPYYDCFETDSDGFLRISKGSGLITRRQDAPHAWQYNGAIYVINPQSIRQMPMGMMPRRIPSPMPRERSVDIDTPLDLIIAESIIKNRLTTFESDSRPAASDTKITQLK